jgi:hypothetical protein
MVLVFGDAGLVCKQAVLKRSGGCDPGRDDRGGHIGGGWEVRGAVY